ncbi:MAG TPA: methyltransferase domain-containing protein [Candidatus Saccharimonadia bacterium]|nr:methyltransferase domain-containing protein [Candidatus Saccharimonadia bacterium]
MSTQTKKDIVFYYKYSQWLYNIFVTNGTLGMHYGFWKPGTKTRQQAVLNENQAMIDKGKITKKDLVLDAGCGIGGPAVYIAKTTGAHVIGLTLAPSQIGPAKRCAEKEGVADRTEFFVMDFTKTTFPDNHFDVVYGIESICYAKPKLRFLKEAYRILKPGGRLVITDGYLARKLKTSQERKIIADFLISFALPELCTVSSMSKQIRQAGFVDLHDESKLKEVIPTVEYLGRLERTFRPIIKIAELFPIGYLKGLQLNALACRCQYLGVKMGLADHHLHWARKPKR